MTSTEESAVLAPELGRYRLVAELARGGMGNVYLAIAQGPGGFHKLLVVKELKPELADDETYVAMFREEARLAARLTHPNIVQTNEVGSDGDRHYMIMEYLDGRSLYRIGRHFAKHGGFPVGAHLSVLAEALLGLHYAHEVKGYCGESLEIVHRDVSPLNVVVTFEGQTKVLDFGIAKAADSSLETQAGVLKGRIAYMAPEQACGGKVDRRADVYSAGVMIWEAAAGRRLWANMNDVEILTHLLREGPPGLRSVVPDAPADLHDICARAMAREPNDRYPTAAALLEDLEAHIARRSDAMPMREVGVLIASAFAVERQRLSALVDDALARARSPRSGVVPSFQTRVIGNATHTNSLSVSHSRDVRDDLASVSSLLGATPSHLVALPGEASIRSDALLVPSASTAPLYASAAPRVERRGTGGRALARALLAGSAFAATAVTGMAALHRTEPARSVAPASVVMAPQGTVAPAMVPIAPVATDTIDVVVRVSPPAATITIDGKPAGANPFHGRLRKDGENHHVVASADGYDTKIEDLPFSGDLSVDLSLDRRAPPPSRSTPPSRGAPQAGGRAAAKAAPEAARNPPPAVAPSPEAPAPPAAAPPSRPEVDPNGGRPLHPIVTANPYGVP
jgi:eukaryotic-like serine/threonine-protein kinase